MKTKTSSMGSLHPVIFFAVVYVVALLLSIFICSSLFYAFNGNSHASRQAFPVEQNVASGQTVVTASAMNLQR